MKYIFLLSVVVVLSGCGREYGEPLEPIATPCAEGCIEVEELD
jgi:hypothetical protein